MFKSNNRKICSVVSAKLKSQTKEEIPVIIRVKDKDSNKLSSQVSSMSGKIKHHLPLIGGVACHLTLDAINQLSKDPNVDYISFDNKVFALLDIANPSIRSQFPHEEGYNGEGVTVAVLDTGVTPHNDLVRPDNRIVGFKDFVNNRSKPYDDNGHGTHVSGIIASNGYSSNGKYAGIAPKANILGVKALDDAGSGSTSDIISAIQWVIDTKDTYNTKILNLSLGSPANDPYYSDPLVKATEAAVSAGITTMVAAGNSGPSKQTILSPGNSPSVVTVGAVDDNKTPEVDDDAIAPFSSRGPTKEGLKKPDLVAPGVEIMSLSNSRTDGYTSLSGTSMATPVISGAAALLYSKHNDLTPAVVKNMLQSSCVPLSQGYEDEGSGMINLKTLFETSPESVPKNLPANTGTSGFFGENIVILLLLLLLFTNKI